MHTSTTLPLHKKHGHQSLTKKLHSSSSPVLEHQLPEAAKLFYTLLGDSKTLIALLTQFGGHTLRIPSRWPPRSKKATQQKHELCTVLSAQQMVIFVKHFSGTDIYIPKCTKYLCEVRNASIVRYFCKVTRAGTSSGDAVQKLARKYHLSDRRIWGILKTCVEEHE